VANEIGKSIGEKLTNRRLGLGVPALIGAGKLRESLEQIFGLISESLLDLRFEFFRVALRLDRHLKLLAGLDERIQVLLVSVEICHVRLGLTGRRYPALKTTRLEIPALWPSVDMKSP
jgi:hypothetical protein